MMKSPYYFFLTLVLFLLPYPVSAAPELSEKALLGEWCLQYTDSDEEGREDINLSYEFLGEGKVRFQINPHTKEFRDGTFDIDGDKLVIKTAQGIRMSNFRVKKLTDQELVAQYMLPHYFSKGFCQ